MILLGFDFGLARTGIATGNALLGTANPLTTLYTVKNKPDWQKIATIIQEWQPKKLIVGIPYQLDGTKTPFTQQVEKFSHQLAERTQLPVHTINEALSSHEAKHYLKQSRRTGRRKRIKKIEIDAVAAAIILETWMSHTLHLKSLNP